MIRLGVVDFDSSHSVEFTKRLNHVGIAEDQWVEGARVVVGCSLPSAITDPATVEKYVRAFRDDFGLPLVDRPEEMLGKIDGVLVESVDGSVHLDRVRPFLEAGIPAYVDKPFTCSVSDARKIIALAARKDLPLFSSSSLRYAPELVAFKNAEFQNGPVIGCDAYGPASLHSRNPGLFHYGIHGVETLFAVMGPGCESVTCTFEDGAEVAAGRWKGGRIGTMRGTRAGSSAFGFTAFCQKKVVPVSQATTYIYRELLKKIVEMFQTKRSPLPIEHTLEIVAFIEAARESAAAGGKSVKLAG